MRILWINSLILILFMIVHMSDSQKDGDWNYFVFTLTWPPTFCSYKKCKLPPGLNDFTIHGLWPSIWPGKQPTNCSAHSRFDIHRLQSIRNKLDYTWANLLNYENPSPFWEHEWYKHGQCGIENVLISNELNYFNTAVELKEKLNLLTQLKSYGIQPNNSVVIEKSHFLNVLKQAYNVSAVVKCKSKRRKDKLTKLAEIRFCFNVKLQLIDCNFNDSGDNNECEHTFIFQQFNSQ
ncbi:Ribonuclease Oy [Schistosoma japonicum]|uniref:Ribonuclease Oy n=1 Tax=Schistosoma japonicum TaxID=6182 RepID=A0A4Z2DFD4_SCHJA|nr:Ribonuclease Oy [Schistosoma japonicum]